MFSFFFLSEIPLFAVLNARITFGNIFANYSSVTGVETIEQNGQAYCTIDDTCFDAPAGYIRLGKVLPQFWQWENYE